MENAIGVELAAVAQHMFRHSQSPVDAMRKLSLRTRCTFVPSDGAKVADGGADGLSSTTWYKTVKERFARLKQRIAEGDSATEAGEVIESMYSNGVSITNLQSAFVTVGSMMSTCRVPEEHLAAAAARAVVAARSTTAHLSREQFVNAFIDEVICNAVVPESWWFSDDAKEAVSPIVIGVALRATPPTLCVEYEFGGKRRIREIHLEAHISQSGSISLVSKKLAASHGFLLSKQQVQLYLLRLQKLIAASANGVDLPSSGEAKPPVKDPSSNNRKGAAAAAAIPSDAPQKADVGKLYRDPEAALVNVDLQDADDLTVREYKGKMDEKFTKNLIRPGDPGYSYDIRLQAKPTQKSEWDDDDDDE